MQLRCEKLCFSYGGKEVLRGASVELSSGEHVWLRGRSGIGKSTFLKILAGILPAREGQVAWTDFEMSRASECDRRRFRNRQIGYIDQDNQLIPHWTVTQNLSLVDSNLSDQNRALDDVGLSSAQTLQTVQTLSGGERQRVDLARLILKKPVIALIDEPTSHLDDSSTERILRLLSHHLLKSTILIVSHDRRLESLKLRQLNFDELNR